MLIIIPHLSFWFDLLWISVTWRAKELKVSNCSQWKKEIVMDLPHLGLH